VRIGHYAFANFNKGKRYIFSYAPFDESLFYTEETPSALDGAALSYTQSDNFTSKKKFV